VKKNRGFEVFEKMGKGKKVATKKGRVAVKREKEAGERENEEEEERKKQKKVEEEQERLNKKFSAAWFERMGNGKKGAQKIVDDEKQEHLNEAFLDACQDAKVGEVKALVERGADLLYRDEDGVNALQCACQNEDYEGAEEIVTYLIEKHKGMLRTVTNEQWSALHFAAQSSSAEICEILIDNGCDVNGRTKILDTPLMNCCCRIDEEALKIAKLLIEKGADLAKKNETKNTVLHLTCLQGRDDVVQLLVDSEASVNAQGNYGWTPLNLAVANLLFGEKIIPILMRAGADVTMKDSNGDTAILRACGLGGGKILKALAPFVAEGCTALKNVLPKGPCPDPIGSMTEGIPFGCSYRDMSFSDYVEAGFSPSYCWSMLRNSEFLVSHIFDTLTGSDNLDLWWCSVTELWQSGKSYDDVSGATLLHLAAGSPELSSADRIEIVEYVMSFKINPLMLDRENERAIDYCAEEEKELYQMLADYQKWKPEKTVMNWYGPFCRQRLTAFLLVEQRLNLGFSRDLKNRILSYVAETEYVWVPVKN
jgi:ankyrin repeat protein